MGNAISRIVRALLGQIWAFLAGKYRGRARQRERRLERLEEKVTDAEKGAEEARTNAASGTASDRRERLRREWAPGSRDNAE